MKVAIVNQPWNHAPPTKGGSIAIWTWEVARRLAKHKAVEAVYVYARRNPGQSGYENVDGVRCVRFPITRDLRALKLYGMLSRRLGVTRYPFKSKLFYRDYMGRVARDLGRRDVDVIHLHNFSQHVPVVRRHNRRPRIVLHMHCEWLTQLDRGKIAKRLAGTDVVLGCSGYIVDKICKRFPEYADRCHVVYNGVDTELFVPDQQATRAVGGGECRLLFVGRITPEKALHDMIDAVARLSKRVPGVRLDIVGPDAETPKEYIVDISDDKHVRSLAPWYDGDYFERLRKLARTRLGDRVAFTGLVAPDNLPPYYQAADLLLNPSVSESFGMSLVESMACGTPVVATRVGGMPEIVDEGRTGLLSAPADPIALSDAVAGLLGDTSLRTEMAVTCRERAVDMFSWDAVTRTVLERYRRLTGVGA